MNTTKNNDGRVLPFYVFPELADLLRQQWDLIQALQRETGQVIPYVFHHRRGKPIRHYWRSWKTATQAAGVPHLIPHDLRRTCVRNLERSGVSRSVAVQLTGHKTEAVYRRYAITNEADLAEGLGKLATLYAKEGTRTPTLLPFPKVGSS